MGEAETEALDVQELNERVGHSIDRSEGLQSVQCRGEVADVSPSRSGVFFTLVDEDHKLSCVAWERYYSQMNLELAAGMDVVLKGKIEYWTEGGHLRLKVYDGITLGEDDRTTATDELTAELGARGWFDETHKATFPRIPETIGVVTSHHGEARHDITTAIHDSAPAVDVVIQDASVQGVNAPQSIANGIRALDQDETVDVIIVGRGGGSTTDLQAFDSEPVAEAIHWAETPIVSAVGHTEDRLIADRVADADMTTPREAGQEVVSGRDIVRNQLNQLEQDLDDAYEQVKREHDHEQEIDHAVSMAQSSRGRSTTIYKAAIVALILVIIALAIVAFIL